MALKLSFNTKEISTLNTEVRASNTTINNLLNSVLDTCGLLDQTINSIEIEANLRKTIEKIEIIKNGLNANIEILTDYLDGQLKEYEYLLSEATRMLREALNFINENFQFTNA